MTVVNPFFGSETLNQKSGITREFAEKLKSALNTIEDFSSPSFQYHDLDTMSFLVSSRASYVNEGLFRVNKPETVLSGHVNWVSSMQWRFENAANSQEAFEAPNATLDTLLQNAPSSARLMIDFLSGKHTKASSQYKFFKEPITDEKLATITNRADYDKTCHGFSTDDLSALKTDFQEWIKDKISRQKITSSSLQEAAHRAQAFFDNDESLIITLRQVNKITKVYEESLVSGEKSNTAAASIYTAKQLIVKQVEENTQKQKVHNSLSEPSKQYVQMLIDKHGGDYVLKNTGAAKQNLIAVTDKGPQEGRVKTSHRINTRSSYTNQLTNTDLSALKTRVDSCTVVITNIIVDPSGLTRITLEAFNPNKSFDDYNKAQKILAEALS